MPRSATYLSARCGACWPSLLLMSATTILFAFSPPIACGNVLVTSQSLGVSCAVYEFDDAGNLLGTLDETPGGDVLFSIATDGERIIAGHAFNGFRQYSLDGAYLGSLGGLAVPTEGPVIEFDSRGNAYVLDAGAPRRLNPDGTTSMTFPPASTEYGIDADRFGNVYISRQSIGEPNGIYKFSPNGDLLNFTAGNFGDLAIDESGQVLYAGYQTIQAFDISGPAPTLVNSIPAPPYLAGISFDPVTGHLLAANLFGGNAWEITTDGAVVRKYSIPGTHPLDVIAIRVPEPVAVGMLLVAGAFLVGLTRKAAAQDSQIIAGG